jgi:hypothetical protein
METAKPEEGAGELEHAQEVSGVLVVADEQRAALGQPGQRPLHDPTPRREPLLAGRWVQLLLADAPDVGHGATRATASSPVGLS